MPLDSKLLENTNLSYSLLYPQHLNHASHAINAIQGINERMPIPRSSDSLIKIHYHHLVAVFKNCRNRVLFYSCFQFKCSQKEHTLEVYVALDKVTKCKEPESRKQMNIKLLFRVIPNNINFFPVLSYYFKYLFHKILPDFLSYATAG